MNGLLAQLFSTIDSKKRQLGGLLSDPAETIYQGIRNFGADQQGLLDTQAQAYPMLATPEQSARIATFKRTPEQARSELADKGAAMGMASALTPFHDDVLRSVSKGVPDDVAGSTFGMDGFIYHTPFRPFENAQSTAIGGGTTPIADRVFKSSKPLTASQMRSIEAVPVSEGATNAFAKELADEGAFGFLNKDGKRFSVVTPSAKNQGQFQATQYDPKGAIGDSQHQSQREAIRRLMDAGYSRILDENRLSRLLDKVMINGQ